MEFELIVQYFLKDQYLQSQSALYICTGRGFKKTKRAIKGKAVTKNNRKADFMLGGLHIIFFCSSIEGSVRDCVWM